MLLANSVVAASFLIAAFDAITAIPHIRERHIIRVPVKFRIIHHHKIQKIPIVIRKHIHYYKDEAPPLEDTHSNHIFHEDSHDHFDDFHREEDHQEFRNLDASYDDNSDTHGEDYEEQEQSQEDDYYDDEYE